MEEVASLVVECCAVSADSALVGYTPRTALAVIKAVRATAAIADSQYSVAAALTN